MTAYQKLLLEALAMRTPAEIAQWKRRLRLMKTNANQ